MSRNGAVLWVARGHYVDVASEAGFDHAKAEVDWADRTLDGWLRRYALVEREAERRRRTLRRERDPAAVDHEIRFLAPGVRKTVLDSVRRKRTWAIPRVPDGRKLVSELYRDPAKAARSIGGIWGKFFSGEGRIVIKTGTSLRFERFVHGHEMFHAFLRHYTTDRLTGSVPDGHYHWLIEGLCDFHGSEAAGIRWAYDLSSTKASLGKGSLPPLATFLVPYPRAEKPQPYCRCDSCSLLAYLHEGEDGALRPVFHRLLTAIAGHARGVAPDVQMPQLAALLRLDEDGLAGFEARFHAWVRAHWKANREALEPLRDEFKKGIPAKTK
jgi:hypothetical protein